MDVKSKRKKGLRSRFKRTKNDERKRQATALSSSQLNVQRQSFSLETLQSESMKSNMPPEWTMVDAKNENSMQLCIIQDNPPVVSHSVKISSDLTWAAYIFGQRVKEGNSIIQGLPFFIHNDVCFLQILSAIFKARICPGSTEDDLIELFEKRGSTRYCKSGGMVAFIENRQGCLKAIRTTNCELICCQSLQRCACCRKYRTQLFVERSRLKKNSAHYTSHDSHVNYRFLTDAQKDERLKSLQQAKRIEKQRNTRLHQLILDEIETNGIVLESDDCKDMSSLTTNISAAVAKSFPADSVQRIFWEQQIKYNSVEHRLASIYD